MSDYTQITDFSAKDLLTTGDSEKIILGADFDGEFSAISTAVATKYDSNDIASEVQAEALTLDTVLITPLQLGNVLQDNAGMAYDIQQLADPAADTILGWDDSAGAAINFTIGTGLAATLTTIATDDAAIDHDSLLNFVADEHVAHSGVSITAGAGLTGGGTIAATRDIAVGAGNGIVVNADDVEVGAGTGITVNANDVAFNPNGLSAITSMDTLDFAADSIVVDDNGTPKKMAIEDTGFRVVSITAVSTTVTLASHINKYLRCSNASAQTLTLNTGIGQKGNFIVVEQNGAGQVTIAGTATIESPNGQSTFAQYSTIVLTCTATNTWAISGDMTT